MVLRLLHPPLELPKPKRVLENKKVRKSSMKIHKEATVVVVAVVVPLGRA